MSIKAINEYKRIIAHAVGPLADDIWIIGREWSSTCTAIRITGKWTFIRKGRSRYPNICIIECNGANLKVTLANHALKAQRSRVTFDLSIPGSVESLGACITEYARVRKWKG